jgi:hypothetical protein
MRIDPTSLLPSLKRGRRELCRFVLGTRVLGPVPMAGFWRVGRCAHYLGSKRVDSHAIAWQTGDTMGQTTSTQCDPESDEQRRELLPRSRNR